ncbi:MAG TPA: 16S rRNA methyltransferase [Parachlamydiales bacterium]|nr:MAG: hypothetical protein A2Z85_01865 [Chlamydiae bacterium GWA2_50_15]OGN69522.1 MAG: hypothetical protein A3I15_02245 [Chlamydiae bacterium RIFCSPLOWO2_02_FULL_49_12]HAZ16169.1 16S rRNA methyltransferase [Parachlamydiales bacterium]HCJ83375.1 16S rRNA methyltransferase [Parachlamydiales bacterium]
MLYLLPNLLHPESSARLLLPGACFEIVPSLSGLICESEKEGRRFLKLFSFPPGRTFRDLPLRVLSEHTAPAELEELLALIRAGAWGLISDCGMPILADPGSSLVAKAQKEGIAVQALSGPSSILLALLLSGLPAQAFSFCGYLSREPKRQRDEIRALEARSQREGATQLLIEAPYRNDKLMQALLSTLKPATLLSIASFLTSPSERVKTLPASVWKSAPLPSLNQAPTLFLLFSEPARLKK